MKRLLFVLVLVGCPGGGAKSMRREAPGGMNDTGVLGGVGYGGGSTPGNKPACKDQPGDPLPSCSGGAPDNSPLDDESGMHVIGAMDKGAIRRVIHDHFEVLRYCYESTLMANPGISGTVQAKFTIGIDGTVLDVVATGIHPDVETCVAAKVRTFKFPRPGAGSKVIEVAYPFTFKPS